MIGFVLNDIKKLAEAMSVIATVHDEVDLEFSPDMVSIVMIEPTSIPTDFIIDLQMFPHFFSKYECDQYHSSWIYLTDLYPKISNLEQSGYSSFTFTVRVYDEADFKFQHPNGDSWENSLYLAHLYDSKHVIEFDYTSFVTMDSHQFIPIVTQFHFLRYVLVTVTSTQVVFSNASILNIILLTPENGECIIGGVPPETEIRFIIRPARMDTFSNMALLAGRIWLFKSINSSKGVMIAVLGLDSRFLVSFPL